ncbi:hypothetical protein LDFHOB_01470 [Candidatus Electronema aureum]
MQDAIVSKMSKVSIHAPVKEATVGYAGKDGLHPVSIHAPVKEATFRAKYCKLTHEFQSTPP